MIPQIEPWIDECELKELEKVIKSTFITEGEATEEFESLIKEYTGSKYVVAMCNGTMALYAILESLDIGEGDEVIVPDMTFVATANAVILAGAKPVFCDIDPLTKCIDVNEVSKLINNRTQAIMPVHLYGLSADLDPLLEICQKHHLFLIEDAAQSMGVKYKDRHTGTFGIGGILSFYGNKTITSAEGGAVLTNHEQIAKSCYRLKNHGRDRKGIFKHEMIGFNFSYTDLQAAIGIAQLRKLNKIIKRKKEIRECYKKELGNIEKITFQEIPGYIKPVFWFTNIYFEDAEGFSTYLKNHNIGTRRFFYPLHIQPCYAYLSANKCEESLRTYNTGVSLPSSYTLTDSDLKYICETIKNYF
ncbi:MAG TPA: DegT/DnrJ/EryC1/StrS family aminotransferase [bacterium]|nr:DegT/DnrJ/EryC1/StrS family aminotransferase [bacterium]